MELLLKATFYLLALIAAIPLSILIIFCVFIPLTLVLFPSHWVFSKRHTEEYGRVYGIRNKLIHHFLNYHYPNLTKGY